MSKVKILLLDIETAPKVALVWKFFKENISPKQVKEHGHIMSYAAKWLGEQDVIYEENRKDNDKRIVASLIKLLDEADMVIAHNGKEFDLKEIRARALVHKIKPPSPVKVIDTLKVAREEFRFPSYSLEYLADVLNLSRKKFSHKKFPGFQLWLECLRKNEKAWEELKEYNIEDVLVLEELYLTLRPWSSTHPNVAVYAEDKERVPCPKCNSYHTQWRGFAYTNTGKYHRFVCNDCGGWSRTRYTLMEKNDKLTISQ